ncbi:MAG: hypothetical protein JO232_15090 [Verrucomicrobia bacterium]|jgi:hypothetical protein|nr:hypothetical protein [Verrucomicrobiota bacterium]
MLTDLVFVYQFSGISIGGKQFIFPGRRRAVRSVAAGVAFAIEYLAKVRGGPQRKGMVT